MTVTSQILFVAAPVGASAELRGRVEQLRFSRRSSYIALLRATYHGDRALIDVGNHFAT